MSEGEKVIWEVWYTYHHTNHTYRSATAQVNVAAHTIEEAIDRVQLINPEENRSVYKVENKGTILE